MLKRSLQFGDEHVFADDFVLDVETCQSTGLSELSSALLQLQRRLKSHKPNKAEFVVMKAIALVNSGIFITDYVTAASESFDVDNWYLWGFLQDPFGNKLLYKYKIIHISYSFTN